MVYRATGRVRQLLYDGSKLFWRVNETLDLCIYQDATVNCVTIRAFQQNSPQTLDTDDKSRSVDLIPPLDIDLRRLRQILGLKAAPKIPGLYGGMFNPSTGMMSMVSNQSKSNGETTTTAHASELITEYLLTRLQARRDSLDRVTLFLLRSNDDEVDPVELIMNTTDPPQALPSDLTLRRRHTIDDVKEAEKEVVVATTRLKNARMKAEELSNLARTTLDNFSKHYGSAEAKSRDQTISTAITIAGGRRMVESQHTIDLVRSDEVSQRFPHEEEK